MLYGRVNMRLIEKYCFLTRTPFNSKIRGLTSRPPMSMNGKDLRTLQVNNWNSNPYFFTNVRGNWREFFNFQHQVLQMKIVNGMHKRRHGWQRQRWSGDLEIWQGKDIHGSDDGVVSFNSIPLPSSCLNNWMAILQFPPWA